MENSTLSYMIESQDKASRELYLEAIKKNSSKTRLSTLMKEATWHTEQILKKVKEIER